jgi:hypothetical protein
VSKQSKALVLRRRELPVRLDEPADGPSPCPSCGRVTATVGQGTCADCWQPKRPDGRPAIAKREPRTEPLGLLDVFDDVPFLGWLFLAVGGTAGLVAIVYRFVF